MTLSEQLKILRKKAGLSQEKLAERIGVSRQAVTKWESGAGIPDVENMRAVSSLFHVSIDELLGTSKQKSRDYIYESVTEYDIDQMKNYDLTLGGGKSIYLSGYKGEKIRIRLVSNVLETLQKDFKVKIDDIKNRIDIDVKRNKRVTEAIAKESVSIFIQLPVSYIKKVEMEVNAENVVISSLECQNLELNLKTSHLKINDVIGNIEIDCNLDMNIVCDSLCGKIAVNQIKATSKIYVPQTLGVFTKMKGIGNRISYEKDGVNTDGFEVEGAGNLIELNGIQSELVICTLKSE